MANILNLTHYTGKLKHWTNADVLGAMISLNHSITSDPRAVIHQ